MRRSMGGTLVVALVASFATASVAEANEASLRGSRAAMVLQNGVAKSHGLTFYRTPADIAAAVARGELVALEGNANYDVADFVRHPFAHPAARLFVERLSAQYRAACGQKLVVTSAVRPANGQPGNAHELSVHPAGMALDLRVSDRAPCRAWLEDALLNMERRGVLNGIRERNPPHYHVAIFPEQYLAYAAERPAPDVPETVAAEPAPAPARPAVSEAAAPDIGGGQALAPQPRSALPLAAAIALLLVGPLGRRALLGNSVP
jgi:hypothetical protein